jgi:hypothetical protein
MNLYLISQSINTGYDTYDSAVVAAESEHDAIRIHPSAEFHEFDENGILYFKYVDGSRRQTEDDHCWTRIENVSCKLIGTATEGIGRGVICASFNAG